MITISANNHCNGNTHYPGTRVPKDDDYQYRGPDFPLGVGAKIFVEDEAAEAVGEGVVHGTPQAGDDLHIGPVQPLVGSPGLPSLFVVQGDTSRAKPPVDSKTKVPFWPAPDQSGTLVLKSTGGFAQRDVSPCT